VGLSLVTLGLGSTVAWVYLSDSRAGIYPSLVMPLIHYFVDAETSHKWAIQLAKYGLVPKQTTQDDEALMTELWGKRIGNPVGLAAGFDKDAEGIDSLIGFGFGTVEIGSVTPLPQPGNPQPRMFRLTQDNAVINRYGFNSKGHEQVKRHLILRLNSYLKRQLAPSNAYPTYDEKQQLHFNLPNGIPRSLKPDRLLGVNLGKNKTSPAESNDDYINGVKTLGPFADYLVVNISSPNTPGLRSLQRREPMLKLLEDVRSTRDKYLQHKPPLLVKVAPDLTEEELLDIAHVVKEAKMDGIIISNTTISRPESLKSGKTRYENKKLKGIRYSNF
jgi:dihydroorotate dehydrogenase